MNPGRLYRILLFPDGDGAGGGPPAPKPAEGDPTLKAIEGLLAKHGGHDGALRVLLAERDGALESARALKGKVPPEGAVVLAGDDAKRYAAYVALGDPEALRTAIEDRDRYKGQVDGHEREKLNRKVGGLLGYSGAGLDAFVDLATLKGLDFEFKTEKGKDNKDAEVPYVKAAAEGEKPTRAEDYVSARLAAHLPAFKPESVRPAGGTPARPARAPVPVPGPAPADPARRHYRI